MRNFTFASLGFLASCLFALSGTESIAQNNSSGGWTAKYQSPKSFIENKSQFDGRDKLPDLHAGQAGSKILFGIDDNGSQIYFTKQGMTCRFDEKIASPQPSPSEREKENNSSLKGRQGGAAWAEHEKEERRVKINTDFVYMQWANSNPDVQIVAEDVTPDYYSYTIGKQNINYIKGYKKLIYKNLYPNIDVEYIFPDGKEGIKYSLILHPGADISKVKMVYSGSSLRAERSNLTVDANGNIHIPTKFGDIIDHAPKTFYADGGSVASSFEIKNNMVTFKLSNFQNSRTLTIDPWFQTPTLAASNGVWECERDGAGNVYIIGGETPLKLQKYNAAGTLQWTYATPWDTINSGNGSDWLGALATDLAGNSYVTNGSIAALNKINSAGGVVWSYSAPAASVDEYWAISFNCDQTHLIIGGTTGNIFGLKGCIFDINTSNGSINSKQIIGQQYNTFPPYINEGRALTSSHNGRYYYLTLDSLGCIDQNFSACSTGAPIFAINSGYNLAYKCENYRPNNGNAGICAIKANKNFVYTQNGTTVQKRSLANGAILGSAAIPGGISIAALGRNQVGNSGIDIDTCGNVYVGSDKKLIQYDANLNQLSSITLPFTVYDVTVSTNGDVIAAGAVQNNSATSRTGYVQSIASSSFAVAVCNPLTLQCCDATICNAGPFCPTDPAVNLSPSTSGGTWSGTGITNTSLGTFNPAVAGSGTFTITYNLGCGKDSMQIVVKPCASLSVCVESNGDLTVSGGTGPYTWDVWNTGGSTPITTQAQCTACNGSYTWFGGTCLNGFMPVTTCTTAASYQQYATGTTATPPGNWPIRVTDNSGNNLVINSMSGIPSCVASVLSVSAVHTNASCNGQCNGTATANASGGTAPLTYSWNSSPAQTTQTASGLCMGSYTVLVTDASATTATATVSVTQPTALTSSATATSASCGSGGTSAVTAAGGTTNYTYAWSPSGGSSSSATGLSAGNYTATVTDANGCSTTSTVSITSASGGTVAVNSSTISCNGGTSTADATMAGGTSPFTYSWSGGQTTSSVTGLSAGNYAVIVTDASGCTTSQSVTITQPTAITSSVSVTNTTCGASTGTAMVTAFGGTGSLTYNWSPSGGATSTATGLGVGNYSCTITDANSCTQIQTANIIASNGPAVTTSSTNPSCSNDATGTASASVTGGTAPYTYLWSTTPPQATQNATGLSAGTYTVIVTDASGCSNVQTVTLTAPSGPNANAGTSVTINVGNSATLTATGGVTYSWNNGAGTGASVVVSPTATTNYCVIVADAGGCTDSACVTVYVGEPLPPCGSDIFIPTAFSPGVEGVNKLECILGDVNCIQTFNFAIYDRWGNKVFEATDPTAQSACWDGTYKGKLMNTAVFVYYLKATYTDGTKVSKKGNISLIR